MDRSPITTSQVLLTSSGEARGHSCLIHSTLPSALRVFLDLTRPALSTPFISHFPLVLGPLVPISSLQCPCCPPPRSLSHFFHFPFPTAVSNVLSFRPPFLKRPISTSPSSPFSQSSTTSSQTHPYFSLFLYLPPPNPSPPVSCSNHNSSYLFRLGSPDWPLWSLRPSLTPLLLGFSAFAQLPLPLPSFCSKPIILTSLPPSSYPLSSTQVKEGCRSGSPWKHLA